ncbi:MAG: M18 family aminopeptidase [Acidimicrobiales bacterium]
MTGVVPPRTVAEDLCRYIDRSPSPYHAAAESADRLTRAGFVRLDPAEPWPDAPGGYVVVDGGALVAWFRAEGTAPTAPLRIVGAHTDSPNLRIKARPDTGRAGWRQVGVEVYGGALVNSWLDRDLGLSGRVAVADDESPTGFSIRLVRVDQPILRVPQLAIHLDREIYDKGLQLNKQTHLVPVWGLGTPVEGEVRDFLAAEAGVEPGAVLGWDIMLHDVTPSTLGGVDHELVFAPRLDNLFSCYAAVASLIAVAGGEATADAVPVIALFDHEEVGSGSSTGADGVVLTQILERAVSAAGGTRDDFLRSLAGSVCVSADMAHATHPNYPERHEPDHHIALNGGPVIKINANQRYASDAVSTAAFQVACDRVGVPTQRYIHRTDMACGSTIGPMTAAGLAIPTVDVGVAQLSMHSIRELTGADDAPRLIDALRAFCTPGTA